MKNLSAWLANRELTNQLNNNIECVVKHTFLSDLL